jgi:hypothetical protein
MGIVDYILSAPPTALEFPSLSEIHNTHYIIFYSHPRGNLKMANRPLELNCPECGKPLKKNKGEARYRCENSACSVISVRHPDKQGIMEIQYEARARS